MKSYTFFHCKLHILDMSVNEEPVVDFAVEMKLTKLIDILIILHTKADLLNRKTSGSKPTQKK